MLNPKLGIESLISSYSFQVFCKNIRYSMDPNNQYSKDLNQVSHYTPLMDIGYLYSMGIYIPLNLIVDPMMQ